tara:strand:- start:10101 stop:10736 length:636 start_codon:yes stop_codon:yes gene_type:complete
VNLQHKVEGFYFRNDYFAIAAPNKCGSSSVRQYLMSHYKHKGATAGTLSLENKVTPYTDTWNDGSVPAAVVIRDPIHRWSSGVIEAVKYITSADQFGNNQSFLQHWDDHVGPMFMHFSNEPVEFKYILLENLALVLQHDVHMNRSDEDSHMFMQIKKIRDPLVRILYEKDREWLEAEKLLYDEMINTVGKEMPTSHIRELIRMSKGFTNEQ